MKIELRNEEMKIVQFKLSYICLFLTVIYVPGTPGDIKWEGSS